MKPRVSIKALLLLVAAIAAACGWNVSQAAERNRELAAISRLGNVSVDEPGWSSLYCDRLSGIRLQLVDHTPTFLRPVASYFEIDTCHRVDSVEFVGVTGTDLIAVLREFQQLKKVSFSVGLDRLPSHEEAETFCHHLEQYAALHHQIEVDYPSDIAEIDRPWFDPSDPFAYPDDAFTDTVDPFGWASP